VNWEGSSLFGDKEYRESDDKRKRDLVDNKAKDIITEWSLI